MPRSGRSPGQVHKPRARTALDVGTSHIDTVGTGHSRHLEFPDSGDHIGRNRIEDVVIASASLDPDVNITVLTGVAPGQVVSLDPYPHTSMVSHPARVRPVDAEAELAGFIAKFTPDMQDRIRGCLAILRSRFPEAVQLIYENYNFLVVGFGPTPRTSDAIFSLAAYARGINLFFLQRGPELPDPTNILRGNGKVVRSVALDSAETLHRAEVNALIEAALNRATIPMHTSEGPQLLIKSVSATQRPRQ